MKILIAFIMIVVFVPFIVFAQETEVYILHGSPGGDADTIDLWIYDRVDIPVYFQAAGDDTIFAASVLCASGINNGYVDRFDSLNCTYHFPFTSWDFADFLLPNLDFYTDSSGHTWDSFSFLSFLNLYVPPDIDIVLQLIPGEPPIHGATFSCYTVYRPELADSIIDNAIGPGNDPVQGQSNMGDTTGDINFVIEERFAHVRFIRYDGAITGNVKNTENEPIESVMIGLLDSQTFTDNNGDFIFPYLPDGTYDLFLSHPDYCDMAVNDITVNSSDTAFVEITLEFGGAISGIVTDEIYNPLADVRIRVVDYENADTTDLDGLYLLNGLCPGMYDLIASATGYIDHQLYNIPVSNNDTTLLDIQMCNIDMPPDIDIKVWAGGYFEGCDWVDTVIAYPGQILEIPVWFYGYDDTVEVADMSYPLGINNGYIDHFDTLNCLYHYPLTDWDIPFFYNINEDWQTDSLGNTWDSYTFQGFAESPAPYNSPLLITYPGDPPRKILTFAVHVRDDLELDNEVAMDAIGLGLDPVTGGINFGDPYGGPGYTYTAYFSPIKFINLYYTPGDANMYNGIWPPGVIGSDVTYLVNYFRGAVEPCLLEDFYCAADVNGDCRVVGSDVTRLVSYFRQLGELSYCPDYPPAWPTIDDIPETMPEGWPECE